MGWAGARRAEGAGAGGPGPDKASPAAPEGVSRRRARKLRRRRRRAGKLRWGAGQDPCGAMLRGKGDAHLVHKGAGAPGRARAAGYNGDGAAQ